MIHLFREALAVQQFLEQRRWGFCFIGGIALQHWGEPRVTRDVDLSLYSGFGGEAGFIDTLLAAFAPRRPDARDFALRYRVLLLRSAGGIDLDVALAGLPFEAEMIDRARLVGFEPDVRLRICSAEDLFVLKAFADRPQDRADLAGIARRQAGNLDWQSIRTRLEPLVAAKEEPAILERVEQLRREVGR